jgi:iron complex outermembrane receptor protein
MAFRNRQILKPDFPKQGVGQILSLNNSIFFKNSKLDADFGYIMLTEAFEDDVAVLQMKLKTLITT